MTSLPVFAASAGLPVGMIGVAVGIMSRRRRAMEAPDNGEVHLAPTARMSREPTASPSNRALVRLMTAAAAGAAVGVLSGWPVGGVFVATACLGVPRLLRRIHTARGVTEKVEAIASWTELLRDSLSAASGLAQALIATAPLSSPAIRDPLSRLADRLSNAIPIKDALYALADELDDPSADIVVASLVLTASAPASRLADLLGALADAMRDEVAMRLRVETSRATARSGVRTTIVFSLTFVALLVVLARSYLSPFGTATGEGVLCIVGGFYVSGVVLMERLVRPSGTPRLLLRTGSAK